MTVDRVASRSIGSAILLVAALCAGGILSSARADGPDSDRVEVKVNAAGLDLNTAEGAGTFLGRLMIAARQACGADEVRDLERNDAYRRCYNQAIVNVIRNVDRPALTQAYTSKYPNEAAQFGMSQGPEAAKDSKPREAAATQ
jgi:UrcA family protein